MEFGQAGDFWPHGAKLLLTGFGARAAFDWYDALLCWALQKITE